MIYNVNKEDIEEINDDLKTNGDKSASEKASQNNNSSEGANLGYNYPYKNSKGNRKLSLLTRFVKRSFDIISSGALLLFLISTMILPILTIVVAIKMGGNPFFTQIRPGKNGKLFRLIKFRTMTNAVDEVGVLLPDEKRLTKFGKTLRETSLDELPELINILFGSMSVVGPRPQLVVDMEFFSQDAMRRQCVRPGLTGNAQINGRNNLTWEERFDFDLEYIDKIGIVNDLKIISKTVGNVLQASDVATNGMETSEDYGVYLLRVGAITEGDFATKAAVANAKIAAFNRY